MPVASQFWAEHANARTDLRSACNGLRLACQNETFVGDCVTEQREIFQGAVEKPDNGDHAEADADEPAISSMETIVPEGWIDPATDSMTPAGYLRRLLSEVQDKHYPMRE